jgi:phosphomevalonate kinase
MQRVNLQWTRQKTGHYLGVYQYQKWKKDELINELKTIVLDSKTNIKSIKEQLIKDGWYSADMEQASKLIKQKFLIVNKKINKSFEIKEIIFQNDEIILGKINVPNISEKDKIVTIIKENNEVIHRKLKNYLLVME